MTFCSLPEKAREERSIIEASVVTLKPRAIDFRKGSNLHKENHAEETPMSLAGSAEVEELLKLWASKRDIQPASPFSGSVSAIFNRIQVDVVMKFSWNN